MANTFNTYFRLKTRVFDLCLILSKLQQSNLEAKIQKIRL